MSLRTAVLRAMCRLLAHRNDIRHVDENSIYIHKEYQKEYQKFKQYYASLEEQDWRTLFEVPRSNHKETV